MLVGQMLNGPIRYAIVRNARSEAEAAVYLPENYRVLWAGVEQRREFCSTSPTGDVLRDEQLVFVIQGKDVAGWTLDGYVIPRYASGLVWAEEIDLSHPIMKRVPSDASPRPNRMREEQR